ncbi:hypothetical protein [Streptomyces varsoviensis]|uniref:hypothetical protein n=1 Tax=Streptomyces varsoviensis TaxID=67373 RepID=UPI0006626A2D|nr:hypothetical protein [Streptomyces varsoviensis]
MPYLIPLRTPLTPEQVEHAFGYLIDLQTGGGNLVAGRADADPTADSFALDEVGAILLSALRDWARDSPTTAAPGIARSIIRFTADVIPAPDHADTSDTLETMRDEHVERAHAAHSAAGVPR